MSTSFWTRFKKKSASKIDSGDVNKGSRTSTALSTTLTVNKNCNYAEVQKVHLSREKTNYSQFTNDFKVGPDIRSMEKMVSKFKELQRRMQHFEMYFIQNKENECVNIGDFHGEKLATHKSNDVMSNLIGSFSPLIGHESRNGFKKHLDRRSIYTNNKVPSCTKHDKNKSNASIVMSMYSTHRPELIEVRPTAREFQAAAEEFIQQAEELKTKIGYILSCTGYTVTSSSDQSVKSNPSVDSTVETRSHFASDPKSFKLVIDTISGQYKEILNILTKIDKRLNDVAVSPTDNTKLKVSESNNSVFRNKTPTKCKKGCFLMRKRPSTEIHIKSVSERSSDKNLEPVVMVYEPIQPEYNPLQKCKFCRYCGRGFETCGDVCKDSWSGQVDASPSKLKSDKGHITSFVYTYSPEFTSPFEDKGGKQKSKKSFKWF